MRDTIDLLEAIGSDASLRHAPAQDLADILAMSEATPCLTKAAATGDGDVLADEFGDRPNPPTQVSQVPGWEEEGDDEDMDEPERKDDDKSLPY
ncbi:hypothetical protein [Luteibacter yeojuensis]|uniref:Uncharacterized protein n=1 Tax=Luteibacter yeojuensis TaxID=345309 RepID=A0A7X5QSP8_9GAMM|nr:hypothetical protein [Luteibacter yeojuensis]NID14722.1 hypothetical protein [Luteibacter yeojuensis]